MPRLAGTVGALIVWSVLRAAAAVVGDGFDAASPNPIYWGADDVTGHGVLTQTDGRLEFSVVTPTAEDQSNRPWIFGGGPYDGSWELQLTLTDTTAPTTDQQDSSFGIDVVNASDPGEDLFVEFYVSRLGGPPVRRGFRAELSSGGTTVGSAVDTGDFGIDVAAVRIAFDASTKVLSAYYDVDPINAPEWMPFASYGVAGSGGMDGNVDLGMVDGDQFHVSVYGFAANLAVQSGGMYGDDFETTGFVPLSSGLVLTNTDHDHQWNADPLIPYELTIANRGATTRTGLAFHEIVPVNTVFSAPDSTPGWSCTPNGEADSECTLPIGDLASGDTRTATFAARVVDGTSPAFDVYDQVDVNPSAADDTAYALCQSVVANQVACCVMKYIAYFACISCGSPAATAANVGEDLDLLLQYRIRDRVFRKTAGGRRVTSLYYQYSSDLVDAVLATPTLIPEAKETVLAWQPGLRALADGQGAAVTIDAAQIAALTDFLDALRPHVGAGLQAAIDRERALANLPSWVGITMDAAIGRLDQLSCERASTYPSVRCRFDELARLVSALVPSGKLAHVLAKAAAAGGRAAQKAEMLAGRGKANGARRALAKTTHVVAGAERRLRSKLGQPLGATKAVFVDLADGLRGDLGALAQ